MQFASSLSIMFLFLIQTQFSPLCIAAVSYKNKIIINAEDRFDPQDLRMEIRDSNGGSIRFAELSDFPKQTLNDDSNIYIKLIEVIGPKLWKLIQENRPVVNRNLNRVSILPKGIVQSSNLHSWKGPASKTFSITCVNGFNTQVVALDYTVLFSYGGKHNYNGAYISNLTVDPGKLEVSWGYKFNLNVEMQEILNIGTPQNPIIGTYINMNYTIDTIAKHAERRNTFFVRADTGTITFVNK